MKQSRSRNQGRRTYTTADITYLRTRLRKAVHFDLRPCSFYNKLAEHFGVSHKAIYNKIARLENR